MISELPNGDDAPQPLTASLEESWIVTQDPPPSNGAAGNHRLYATSVKRRHRSHQPKGTKPRRMRANRKMSTASDDSDSLTSSIAVIPSPEPPRAVVAAAAAAAASNASSSSVLGASLASAKQAAAISAAHMVHVFSFQSVFVGQFLIHSYCCRPNKGRTRFGCHASPCHAPTQR